jgi:geranylgeranylglycerol-phosphate geranylgeranyltransferase
MNKLGAVLKLTRIEHGVMLIIAVVAAELMVSSLPDALTLLFSITAPVFISMASFAINDYFDVEVDRLNKKNRPLVKGHLKTSHALYISAFFFIIGVGLSAMINIYAFTITIIFAALAILYSYRMKELFLLGNIYIAFTMVIPFIFGNYVVSPKLTNGIMLVSAMVFMSGLAREIHGTIRDYKGDIKVRNVRSLPKVLGIGTSALLALVLYIIAIIISAYLFFAVAPFMMSPIYGIIITVSDLMLLYVAVGYVVQKSQKFYEKTRNVSLISMGLALVAIVLSALIH